jgi:hypothetical protein
LLFSATKSSVSLRRHGRPNGNTIAAFTLISNQALAILLFESCRTRPWGKSSFIIIRRNAITIAQRYAACRKERRCPLFDIDQPSVAVTLPSVIITVAILKALPIGI